MEISKKIPAPCKIVVPGSIAMYHPAVQFRKTEYDKVGSNPNFCFPTGSFKKVPGCCTTTGPQGFN